MLPVPEPPEPDGASWISPSQLARATIANIAACVKMVLALVFTSGRRAWGSHPEDDCALSPLSCNRTSRTAFGVEQELLGRMEILRCDEWLW
jgi:hypothetical protein